MSATLLVNIIVLGPTNSVPTETNGLSVTSLFSHPTSLTVVITAVTALTAIIGIIIHLIQNSWVKKSQARKAVRELKLFFDSELVAARVIVWKGIPEILKAGGIMSYYDSISLDRLLDSPDHLLLHHQKLRYFWDTLLRSDVDWDYAKTAFNEHYYQWYANLYLPGVQEIVTSTPDNWFRSTQTLRDLAVKLLTTKQMEECVTIALAKVKSVVVQELPDKPSVAPKRGNRNL